MYNNPCLNMNEIFLIVERIIYLDASLLNDHWPLGQQAEVASMGRRYFGSELKCTLCSTIYVENNLFIR